MHKGTMQGIVRWASRKCLKVFGGVRRSQRRPHRWVELKLRFYFILFFFIIIFFKFYFIFKLYIIVLVLPNIKMNPPQVYMCSPSWTLLPPPSPYHPSGSSQCTSPKHLHFPWSNWEKWNNSAPLFGGLKHTEAVLEIFQYTHLS